MKSKSFAIIVFIFYIFLFFLLVYCPISAQEGRSFHITDYEAQVLILENGNAQVRELFTYSFKGNFNGIIRDIGLKGSDGLNYFRASEYSPQRKPLEITQSSESEMVSFRIYDQASNETKIFLLEYELENVITKYNDIAEFYWKFFDKTNTSPIDRITIEVFFPNQTISVDNIKVFGHGPAQGEVSIDEKGFILYQVAGFPAGEMVEARILFPTSFVPSATRTVDQERFDQIMKEELNWAKKAERQSSFMVFGLALIPVILI
ncbi:MAG TPA: DUF2207 domain-containing protein, partial [Atribacterota bacterium]|nr:DUF2207 domain-containing protein [Atribacterota bacterium]